jgi:hypothetical protein
MALARIITHSDLCARELAFHLLGRGYAVEIVSPDFIPNNFADLELRVDGQSGDQLVASLEAHAGQHTAALEFVHRVKAPMEEFTLTPPVVVPRVLDNPVVIKVDPDVADIEADVDSANAAPQSLELESLPIEAMPSEAKSAATIERQTPGEPLSYFARQTSSIALPLTGPAVILPTWKPQLIDRAIERKSVVPAALTLAAIVLLALFLAFGVRQTAKASDGSFTPTSAAAMPDKEIAPSPRSEKVATVDRPSPNRPVVGRPKVATSHRADRIAPNTVVYLDSRYKPLSKPKPKTKQR